MPHCKPFDCFCMLSLLLRWRQLKEQNTDKNSYFPFLAASVLKWQISIAHRPRSMGQVKQNVWSETKMTAWVLKQDPNTKGSKNAIYQDKTQIANFQGSPLFRLDGWACVCSWAMLVTLTYKNNTTRPWWRWELVFITSRDKVTVHRSQPLQQRY